MRMLVCAIAGTLAVAGCSGPTAQEQRQAAYDAEAARIRAEGGYGSAPTPVVDTAQLDAINRESEERAREARRRAHEAKMERAADRQAEALERQE